MGLGPSLMTSSEFDRLQTPYFPIRSPSQVQGQDFSVFLGDTIQCVSPRQASWGRLPQKGPALPALSQGLLLEEPQLRHPFKHGPPEVQRDCESVLPSWNKSLAEIMI